MTQPHVLELAKQGDPQAIATLMNQSLQPRGMTATVERQGEVLEVVLEADRVPNRDALTAFVQKGIGNLGVESIQSVRIIGQQAGAILPAWMQELDLMAIPEMSHPGISTDLQTAPPVEMERAPEVAPTVAPVPSEEMSELTVEELGAITPEILSRSIVDDETLSEALPNAPSLNFEDQDFEGQDFESRNNNALEALLPDPQQQHLEAQLESLWAESEESAQEFDLSLNTSEPISEAEFQDLFAEEPLEPSTDHLQDLFAEEPLVSSTADHLQDLLTDDPSSSLSPEMDLFSTSSDEISAELAEIDDLFGEEMETITITEDASELPTSNLYLLDDSVYAPSGASSDTVVEGTIVEEDWLIAEELSEPIAESSNDLFPEEPEAIADPTPDTDFFASTALAPGVLDLPETSVGEPQTVTHDLFAEELPGLTEQPIADLFAAEPSEMDSWLTPDMPESEILGNEESEAIATPNANLLLLDLEEEPLEEEGELSNNFLSGLSESATTDLFAESSTQSDLGSLDPLLEAELSSLWAEQPTNSTFDLEEESLLDLSEEPGEDHTPDAIADLFAEAEETANLSPANLNSESLDDSLWLSSR
ncbi:MAG: hypothetical protein HC772_16080, partial [Leptolyngbyaceae cyanobacterium CRU_2_3]|nr:hypothetical protein [Leptolyngbyaceae cyanobacterium CRU_2_3]